MTDISLHSFLGQSRIKRPDPVKKKGTIHYRQHDHRVADHDACHLGSVVQEPGQPCHAKQRCKLSQRSFYCHMLVDRQQACAALQAVPLYPAHHELASILIVVITSGAMYSTVPTGLMATSCFMLMVSPKSPSFTRPSPPMKMFSSLISLHLHSSLSLLQRANYFSMGAHRAEVGHGYGLVPQLQKCPIV